MSDHSLSLLRDEERHLTYHIERLTNAVEEYRAVLAETQAELILAEGHLREIRSAIDRLVIITLEGEP